MSTATDLLAALGRRLDETGPAVARLDTYYAGRAPAAFLSPEARAALAGRLQVLGVNFPRLAVDSLAERLRVEGFRRDGTETGDGELWRVWRASTMVEQSGTAHVEALTVGRTFVTVWAGPDRATPRVAVESARQMAVARDPGSGEVTGAVKRWTDDGHGLALVFEPDRITRVRTEGRVVDGAGLPLEGWQTLEVIPNRVGRVPVVPIVNRGRLLDLDGVSEMADLLDLSDALAKVMSDAMVGSEFFARPRRWATGLEIPVDDNGEATNPFASEADKVWLAESPETRFGQFDPARLDSYTALTATLTQQIGSLAALPPHYLGLHSDQPTSADAIRSAEANLVARAQARQRTFGAAWSDVARLIVAVRDGTDPAAVEVEPVWADAETRTPAQAADAAVKLVAAGILPIDQALDDLGYSPAQIERMRTMRRTEALDGQGIDLRQLAAPVGTDDNAA